MKAETVDGDAGQEVTSADSQEIVDDDAEDDEENFDDCVTSDLSDDELLEIIYEITSKWDNHYNVNVTLKNVSGGMIDDWEVYFDFKDKIENIWNARIVESEEGESVVIHNADWNQDILKDESVTFGMTVSYEGEIELPEECYLTREQVEVDEENYVVEYIQNSKWENHVNGQIKITNVGTDRIEDWKFDFETTIVLKEIENIWNANLIEIDEGTYCQVDNATYNQNIEPGQSVEFGFIAKCAGDIEIEETTLYCMESVEYEDDEIEIVDKNNPYWEPKYDLDDFDTYEEYEEYCNKIGYHPISLMAGNSAEPIEPFVKTKIVCDVDGNGKGKAIQSFLWDTIKRKDGKQEDVLLTLFRNEKKAKKGKELTPKQKKTNNSAYFSKATKTNAGYYSSDQPNAIKMLRFSHGQSFERCIMNKEKKYIMAAGAKDGKHGWSKEVAFIDDSTLLNAKKPIKYTNNTKIKKITGFKYLVDKSLSKKPKVRRIDTALSANGQYLVVWIKVESCNQRIVALLKMSEIENELYNKGTLGGYYSLRTKQARDKIVVAVASAPASKLQPNGSFQSIEVSNKYAKNDKWKIYITSGNTGKKGQDLTVMRAVLSKDDGKRSATLTNFSSVGIKVPYNGQGTEILSGNCELEGCHIKGDELQFIMTKSNPEAKEDGNNTKKVLKVEQYIVGIDKKFK